MTLSKENAARYVFNLVANVFSRRMWSNLGLRSIENEHFRAIGESFLGEDNLNYPQNLSS